MAQTFSEYRGMSYADASVEASRLITSAYLSGLWARDLPERLFALREEMNKAQTVAVLYDAPDVVV